MVFLLQQPELTKTGRGHTPPSFAECVGQSGHKEREAVGETQGVSLGTLLGLGSLPAAGNLSPMKSGHPPS